MNSLMLLAYILVVVIVLGMGFIAGYLSKGINITINKNGPEPIPYDEGNFNTSTEDLLPDEVRDYYEKQKGMMNV